ncbi:hypothetical protein BGZ65_000733 [Modicella reniformis]|uniref:Mitochondrial adapter protein MCP1 transmembrane domain-containing protein n=1 Tax=Modicella reniformis TaxID=1440133 RepID=A0A9P6SNP3_9FUNG|nr:hypothetical protein BGZ65_000733 [Modicella reniformis]
MASSSSDGIEPYNVWAVDDVPPREARPESEATPTTYTITTAGSAGETTIIRNTTSTTQLSRTGGDKANGSGFPSVGLYQGLGRWQAYSAIAFGAFGIIHLVPPMLASVGGINLANKALIWGRVYYQTYGFEEVLVYGSLMVHLGTSLGRVAVRIIWKAKAYIFGADRSLLASTAITTVATSSSSSSSPPGSSTSVTSSITTTNSGGHGSIEGASALGLFPRHRLVGWMLTPLVLVHMDQMRMVPVKVFGDSSMIDYSYITFLHQMRRPAPYVLLVGLMAYHMFSGAPIAVNMVLPKGSGRRIKTQELVRSKRVRAAIAGVVSMVTLVGVYRIMSAKGGIPMAKLYRSLL